MAETNKETKDKKLSKKEEILSPYIPVIFDKNFDHIEKTNAIFKAMQAHTDQVLDKLEGALQGRFDTVTNGKYKSEVQDAKVHEIKKLIKLVEDISDE